MHITVLSDNNGAEGLAGEWGLSILIEQGEKRILLDAGSSDLFLKNAAALGKDLTKLDFAVLSHAHYDHADGFVPLLRENPALRVYVQKSVLNDCYAQKEDGMEYIGVAPALIEEFERRLLRVDGQREIAEGVWLIPHKGRQRSQIGARERMYIKSCCILIPDEFSHEQSLVFETEKGLCIFNSCSHAGASEIIDEVCDAFPGRKVYAYVGGFHLYKKTAAEVEAFAERLAGRGVERILTGHCTGDEAFGILKARLGGRITQFRVGLEAEI